MASRALDSASRAPVLNVHAGQTDQPTDVLIIEAVQRAAPNLPAFDDVRLPQEAQRVGARGLRQVGRVGKTPNVHFPYLEQGQDHANPARIRQRPERLGKSLRLRVDRSLPRTCGRTERVSHVADVGGTHASSVPGCLFEAIA